MTRFEIPAELAGERADRAVAKLAELTRSTVARLFERAAIGRLDGAPLRRSDRLEPGTVLWVEMPEPNRGLVPVDIELDVLFDSPDLAVVDKPSGLVTHPGSGTVEPTLAAGLLAKWPQLEGVGQENRWGLVHRLDKDTSGALLVAKTQPAYEFLSAELAGRRVGRLYRTVCHNVLEFGSGTIDAPIARDRRLPTRFAVVAGGRDALTHYERLERWPDPGLSMARVRLETGRTHQIRVHFASIGHPLVGDGLYGGAGPVGIDPGRVWLHAEELRFVDPTGHEHEVVSSLPDELRESLASLGTGLDSVPDR